jgi:hypothetical protein
MDDYGREKRQILARFILICILLTAASVFVSSMPEWLSATPLMLFAGPPLLISNLAGLILPFKPADAQVARSAQQAILHFTYFFVLLAPICSALLKRVGVKESSTKPTRVRFLIALTVHLILYVTLILIVRSE